MSSSSMSSNSAGGGERRAVIAAGALLVLAGLCAYGNSFSGAFVFDDRDSIEFNDSIKKLWPLTAVLDPSRQGLTVTGRPLVSLSLAVNYALSGLDVRSYHYFNVAIHLAAGLTLFGLIRQTLRLPQFRPGGGAAATEWALICALLWTVHPLQTESVTYIIQRAESLGGLFYLGTLYWLVRGHHAAHGGEGTGGASTGRQDQAVACYTLAVLSDWLGVCSKEVTVSIPFVALLYDRIFLASSFREAWFRRWGLYLGLAAGWVLQGVLVYQAGSRGGSAGFSADITPLKYLATQPQALLHYLRLCFWPHPLILDYGKTLPVPAAQVVYPALLLLLLALFLLRAAWKWPWVGWVTVATLSILAPSSSIIPIATQAMAEHRMYVPLAGVLVLTVFGLRRLCGEEQSGEGERGSSDARVWFRRGVAAACILVCLVLTQRRNRDYATEESIWADTVAKLPQNARARNNLGSQFYARQQFATAEQEFEAAIRLNQKDCDPYHNRSLLREKQGDLEGTLADMQKAALYCPFSEQYAVRYAVLLVRAGRPAEAIAEYSRALKIVPTATALYYDRANCYVAMGKPELAIEDFSEVVRRSPEMYLAWNNRGNLFAQIGRLPESIRDLSNAIALRPELPDSYRNRAISYFENRQFAAAWADVDACVRRGGTIDPQLLEKLNAVAPRSPPPRQ